MKGTTASILESKNAAIQECITSQKCVEERQICDMVNQIFFKNMKGKGNISWRDTRVTLSDTCDTAFLAQFLKITFFLAISVEQGQMDTFHRAKLQY